MKISSPETDANPLFWEQRVGGSNPLAPTNKINDLDGNLDGSSPSKPKLVTSSSPTISDELPASSPRHQHQPPTPALRVAVGVCTCKRPKMLERCLDSLGQQLVTSDILVTIVVVDNESEPNNHYVVNQFSKRSPFPVVYVHEPRRGIAHARNAVLDKATEIAAEWIAFIDDDEMAEADWLAELMSPEYLDVPVLIGRHVFVYPQPLPFWCTPTSRAPCREGKLRTTAPTGNVRFSTDLLLVGLRFDGALGLTGGEDTVFFAQAHQKGFEIRCTNRAIVSETAHPERLTYFGQMYREYCSGLVSTFKADMLRVKPGHRRGIKGVLATLIGVVGIAELLVAPLCIVAGVTGFKARALSGGRKIARAAGRAAALLGFMAKPYKNVVGH